MTKEEILYHPRLGFVPKSVPILDEQEEEYEDLDDLLYQRPALLP